jgi:hypothetical protein
MAGKFVDLKEAAKMIDVPPEELVEMRSRGDIFGYRDGASWKFKLEEVERVVRERGAEARSGGESAVLAAKDEEFENLITGLSSKILAEKAQEESEAGSVLISEQELGVSAKGGSTIIGKSLEQEVRASDSDLRLADESGKGPTGGGSDKLLEAPTSKLESASASDVLHGSDIKPASGSGTGDMKVPKPGSTGGFELGPNLALGDEDDLELGSDSALDDEIRPKTGSGKGSDVTLGTGDSGINLSPSDSGLSLEEEPVDLGGSGVESLDAPGDEEVIAVESEGADPDVATQVKADNEFLLSAGDSLQEDESDSGSQVIALEDSESFDTEAATMLKAEPAALGAEEFQPVVMEQAPADTFAPSPAAYVTVPAVEPPYSIWNVLSLSVVAGILALSGMMMVDVMLNMWSFNGTTSISTGIMDSILSVIGVSK